MTTAAATWGVPVWHLLAAIGAITLLCRGGGWLAQRVGQPRVVGEIVAGVALGPSLTGMLAPGFAARLVPAGLQAELGILATVGVVLFVFGLGVGLERSVLSEARAALLVSNASIALPFVGGCLLALLLRGPLGPSGPLLTFSLFMGIAMSITAFPVLGRILDEVGLTHTRVGQTAIVCAAIDDVTAWIVLSAVAALGRAGSAAPALGTLLIAALLAVFMLGPVRALLGRLKGTGAVDSVALVAGIALATAAASDWIGLHPIFGAFLAGCSLPRRGPLREQARRLAPLVGGVLLPLFFFTSGLQVDIRGLARHPSDLLVGLAILGVAVSGKILGGYGSARLAGWVSSEAMTLGVLLNTRGLTELIVLGVGLELGVLPPRLYSLMVMMALVTTAMTTPLLRRTATGLGGPRPADRRRAGA